jgi:stearoyl-CoA desaturase (delta-9 desaturase)
MGWLLCKKHPDVKKFGSRVSMKDLEADPIVMFQHKHYMNLMYVCAIFIPTFVPVICWGETLKAAFFAGFFRYVLSLHITWLINSAAHT